VRQPRILVAAVVALLACATVAPAADRRPAHPALEADDPDAFEDDDQVEPSLPDEEPPGPEEGVTPRPRSGPRSAPTLPEDDEPPPAELEPAGSSAAQPAAPAQPRSPVSE
jgi:hypothetical protein